MSEREQIRDRNLAQMLSSLYRRTDRLFYWLLLAQWAFAIVLSSLIAGYSTTHRSDVLLAVLGGLAINALPITLIQIMPGSAWTRHVVAVAQMSWSVLLIHITGGRLETHFHIFGSLAFLAFYRDWRILVTAMVVVAAEHLRSGIYWPQPDSQFAYREWWRFLEHAGWIVFEDIVLVLGCGRAIHEMRLMADREAALALVNTEIERQVEVRTAELRVANESIASEMQAKLRTESELRQAQKLEAVGRLASGVAHEINTPVQFVSDSVHFLRDASKDLTNVLLKLQRVQKSVLEGRPATEAAREAAAAAERADIDYILEHIPPAFERTLDGLGRVVTIVRSMKDFAHPDSRQMVTADLNRAIENTLVIARNEYKYVADVETDFAPLPPVRCHIGDVNQAVLNIVVNAGHAVGDVVKGTDKRGKITVRTRVEGDDVVIEIQDTGGGIPDAIRHRIFDPFFTTKDVGKGSGQGLAIARSVIVDKHKGQLTLTSEMGVGTTFRLSFRVNGVSSATENGGGFVKRVLFVDDDQHVLDGLRNMLRKQRNVWDMAFVLDGVQALDELSRHPVDVIVSDVRMPGMDGPTLLAEVRERHPTTARIVLSGHAEQSDILRVVPVSHQYLSKPCDASSLRIVIERACVLQNLLQDKAIRAVIGRIDRLPSVPRTYAELTRLVGDPKTSIDEIAQTIEQDPAMAIKILQLSNSAYFGVARRLTSIRQAVMYLGIEMLRGLALTAQISALVEQQPVAGFSLEHFQRSSLLTARLARSFVKDPKLAEEAFTAGIVHDIGKFILTLATPEKVSAIALEMRSSGRSLHALEREQLGVTHAEIGAYLLGMWGLPLSIVEAVAHHHEPSGTTVEGRELLAVVHAADALIDLPTDSADAVSSDEHIDVGFLERAGCAARLPEWRILANRLKSGLAPGET